MKKPSKPSQPAKKPAARVLPAKRVTMKPVPAARMTTKPQKALPARVAVKPVVVKPIAAKAAANGTHAKTPVVSTKPASNGTHSKTPPVVAAKPPLPTPKPTIMFPPSRPAVLMPPRPPGAQKNGFSMNKLTQAQMPKPVVVVPGKNDPKPATPAMPENTIPAEKDLSMGKGGKPGGGVVKDRIVLMVPDPYWLHTYWELSYQSIQRAEVALGQDWHGAKPIVRLFDVTSQDTTSTSETPLRDISVHGGCNHWYIDIQQPPRSYRADVGFISRRGQFYVLARSNVVTPPKAGASETVEEPGWTADMEGSSPEKILAMSTGYEQAGGPSQLKELFDEQFRKPMKEGAFGTGATPPAKLKKFFFELDAELIVYGKTDATASVTLQNEPVKLRPDGTFTMRFSLPDSRQIIPAVAASIDGLEERTIVLAVERNTKHLDPMVHDLLGE